MPSRRALIVGLAGAVAAVVADLALDGPGHRQGTSHAPVTSSHPPSLDAFRRAAAADERSLIDAYEAASRDHPPLAATLALPLAHHREHLAALTRGSPPSPSVPPTTTSSGPAAGASTVAARRGALDALRTREVTAAASRSTAAVNDVAGGALLAQIAAAESVHVDYLAAAITAVQPPVPAGTTPAPLRRGSSTSASPLTTTKPSSSPLSSGR